MAVWSSSYELTPAQTDAPSTLGTTGRGIRVDIRERWENEHTSYTSKGGSSGGSVSEDMIHKPGSAKAYYQSSTPAVRPDGSTSLGSSDAGRIWVDTSVGRTLKVWTGSSWQAISFAGSLQVYANATDYAEVGSGSGYGYVRAYRSGTGYLPLYLNQGGSWVSVGTTSNPSSRTLYVAGTIEASSTIYAGGFSTGGSVSAGSVSASGTISGYMVTASSSMSTPSLSVSGQITAGSIACYSYDYDSLLAYSGEIYLIRPFTIRIYYSLGEDGYGYLEARNGSSWYQVASSVQSGSRSGNFVITLNPGRYRIVTNGTYHVYSIGKFG